MIETHVCAGNDSAEVASRAQQLLEHSLLSELHAVVARALSGLDMFAGNQLSESDLYGSYGQDLDNQVCRLTPLDSSDVFPA